MPDKFEKNPKNIKKNNINLNFICTGNTCRSYIAEAIAIHLLKTVYYKKNPGIKNKVVIGSAGTDVRFTSIPVNTFRVLEKLEIPNIKFAPTPVDRQTIFNSDLIITMASSHKKNLILEHIKIDEKKVFNLIELSNVILYLRSEDIFKRETINRNKHETAGGISDNYRFFKNIDLTSIKSSIQGYVSDKKTINTGRDSLGKVIQKIDMIKSIRTESLIKTLSVDVEDPFGSSFTIYLKVAKLIKENIITIFDYLFS